MKKAVLAVIAIFISLVFTAVPALQATNISQENDTTTYASKSDKKIYRQYELTQGSFIIPQQETFS